MKTIFRIEHICGNGIWRAFENSNYIWETLSFKYELDEKHSNLPTPLEDFGIFRNPTPDEYFAFESIEQMNLWIEKNWFKELIEKGFKILSIITDRITIGEYQVLFKKSDIISITDITHLFV